MPAASINLINAAYGAPRALAIASLKTPQLASRISAELASLLGGELGAGAEAPVLVVVPNRAAGQQLLDDLQFFTGCAGERSPGGSEVEVLPFFSWEVLPFDALSPALQMSASRIHALHSLHSGRRCIVVASIEALMQRVMSPRQMQRASFSIDVSAEQSRDEIAELLKCSGYVKGTLVEGPGEYAVRGSVVDVYPVGCPSPVRIETFRSRIESIRWFDMADQRSVEELRQITIIPAREIVVPFAENRSGQEEAGASLDDAVAKLRSRASDLHIPLGEVTGLEDALKSDLLWPGIEHICPIFGFGYSAVWEHLHPDAGVVLCDREELELSLDRHQALIAEREKKANNEGRLHPRSQEVFLSGSEVMEFLQSKCLLQIEQLDVAGAEHGAVPPKSIRSLISSQSELRTRLSAERHSERPFLPFVRLAAEWGRRGCPTAVVASLPQRVQRMRELLAGYDIEVEEFPGDFPEWLDFSAQQQGPSTVVWLLHGQLSEGVFAPGCGISVVFERELFPDWSPRRRSSPARNVRRFLGTLSQLQEGDFIVHVDHGVGKYCGLKEISVDGKTGDFLNLEYAGEAKLFLPVENISKIQKFVGVEGRTPQLNRLGTKTWEQTRRKVKKNVAELAGRLISLYAQRQIADGFSFGPEDTLDHEFADTFPFEPTPDQQQAIEEVLGDMADEKPMDRLVCGDVGYGKTEIALRAAFKAVNNGRQAALLVPTTVLAEQHYAGFKERFEGFPLRVACVSRFFSAKENAATLADLRAGKVDVIIGTHRLLQKDVLFKDLGLLVIDEEHRFGVASKEKLKEFRKNVDVLTLTATPIPRTLHMSLLGIRDLSVIETPPCDRQVIRTYLAPYETDTVREAILREVNRAGQVFYVHNRVQNINGVADEVAELVPEARIAVAHGQMKEAELSKVMRRFLRHEIDVLVCTTIVESGLDIANANTIIVRNAERFGLAQLYQLRGRVGRSSRRAYAYLMISGSARLGTEARKRLEVLQSLDDLGVGFRLALQDMEIRGAGNLLGRDQSGPVNMVGFDLYSQILKDAVYEIRKQHRSVPASEARTVPQVEPEMKIGFPAHIPPDYIPDVAERLLLYQKLVELENEADGRGSIEDIEDRFGRPPEDVYVLVELMVFRSLLRCAGVVEASYQHPWLHLVFHSDVKMPVERLMSCISESAGRLKISPNMKVSFKGPDHAPQSPNDLVQLLKQLLNLLQVPVLDRVSD